MLRPFALAALLAAAASGATAQAADDAPPPFELRGEPRLYVAQPPRGSVRPTVYLVFRTREPLANTRLVLSSIKGQEGRVYKSATARNCYRAGSFLQDRNRATPLRAGRRYRAYLVTRPSLRSEERSVVTTHDLVARRFTPTRTRQTPGC